MKRQEVKMVPIKMVPIWCDAPAGGALIELADLANLTGGVPFTEEDGC
jgi:hypothetical protein